MSDLRPVDATEAESLGLRGSSASSSGGPEGDVELLIICSAVRKEG